jgi:glyoxylase-like metal-dependent hydrolase (beta-lactamase superfamily II)
MSAGTIPYTKGLHQLNGTCYAWLMPDGTWGWSNAGLITGAAESLLIDTLFDVPMTREMLNGLAPVTEENPIRTVVNTHANGDHWFGNELVSEAQIIASAPTAAEMRSNGPELIRGLLTEPGALGQFANHIFAPFDFESITPTVATRTFDDELELQVGDTEVRLYNLGPAHTTGDTVVYVPGARTLYAGDLLFIGGTPISWAGPISHWIEACQFMLDLEVDTIVPGHGPVTDKVGVQAVMDYLRYVEAEATKRHADGLTAAEAAREINLGRFAELNERGRLAQNVLAVYYELDPEANRVDTREVFRRIGELEGFAD